LSPDQSIIGKSLGEKMYRTPPQKKSILNESSHSLRLVKTYRLKKSRWVSACRGVITSRCTRLEAPYKAHSYLFKVTLDLYGHRGEGLLRCMCHGTRGYSTGSTMKYTVNSARGKVRTHRAAYYAGGGASSLSPTHCTVCTSSVPCRKPSCLNIFRKEGLVVFLNLPMPVGLIEGVVCA